MMHGEINHGLKKYNTQIIECQCGIAMNTCRHIRPILFFFPFAEYKFLDQIR